MYKYQRIEDLREDHDLKQDALAHLLGTTKQQYSLWERGEREFPFHNVIKLALYFNVTIDYLAGLINEPKPLREEKREEKQ